MLNRDATNEALRKIRITIQAQDNGCLTDEETFKLIAGDVLEAAGTPVNSTEKGEL